MILNKLLGAKFQRFGQSISLFCVLLGWSVSAAAWSDFVHESICAQAYQRLSKTAQHLVQSLSQGENQAPGYENFPRSCVWADQARFESHRATYEYHFINVPRGESLLLARDCATHDCVNQAIVRYAIYLSESKRRPQQRAEALRFLGHFVADLHQPLHVGYKEDRGGNDIHVFWREEEKNDRLHSLWDGRIPRDSGLGEEAAWHALMATITTEQVKMWSDTAVDRWAMESFVLARDHVYRNTEGVELHDGERLGDAYFAQARPLMETRIQQAVVRLAFLIEQAAMGPLSGASFSANE